jgi:hypothetical protein
MGGSSFNRIEVTLLDDYDAFELKMHHGDTTISLYPDCPESLDPTFPCGRFDGGCSNGEFKFSWDIQKGWMKATVTKSGDGNGGSMDVKIMLNAEECEDLKTKLLHFKDMVEKIKGQ